MGERVKAEMVKKDFWGGFKVVSDPVLPPRYVKVVGHGKALVLSLEGARVVAQWPEQPLPPQEGERG